MPELEPLIGKTIAGRYRVTDMIGMGGMGAVYAAVQEPLGRSVALKVLKPGFARDEVAVARFKKEAAIVAELTHPNIVTLHDYGETEDGTLYIVMERLRGSTLSAHLRGRGAMAWPRTLPIIQDIVRALATAHKHGVIHRDLKLDNVMLAQADDGRDIVKVLDFGVAKTLRAVDEQAVLTQTDSSPGTPGYMSPELARGISNDPRSDFYALGVVWFELIVGRRPFTDKNAMDVFLHQMTLPTPSIRKIAPHLDVPVVIDELVTRLLDKNPAGRPADTDALLDAIFAIEDAMPTDPRRRRSTSGEVPSAARSDVRAADVRAADVHAADVRAADVPTSPTGAGMFLPTQAGGAPPFTGDAARVTEDARFVHIHASTNTVTITDPIVPPEFRSDSQRATTDASSPVNVVPSPAVELARAQPRARAPIAAAVVALAGVAVFLVARTDDVPVPHHDVDVDTGVDTAARGPLAYKVQVIARAPESATNAPPVVSVPAMSSLRREPSEARAATTASIPATEIPEAVPASGEIALGENPIEAVTPPPPSTPSVDVRALRERMTAANNQIRERFLLPDDVPGYRQLSMDITRALDAGRADDAEPLLRELEGALSSLRITEVFIRNKRMRVEANFPKDWPRNDKQRAELAKLKSDVAERFGANDLPGANYALNKLWLFSLKARQSD